MTALRGWGLPEQHLALDALVAFVDGELSPSACDRAASHLAHCPACSGEASAQRQARAAVRAADTPSISSSLLRALESIPSEAELPGQPDELALTEDGQLVTAARRDRSNSRFGAGTDSVLGSGAALSTTAQPDGAAASDHPAGTAGHGRRTRQGAGVVFSGLVLGALAFMNIPGDDQRVPDTTGPLPLPGGAYGNAVAPASAHLAAPPAPPTSDSASLSSSARSPRPAIDTPLPEASAMLAGTRAQQ